MSFEEQKCPLKHANNLGLLEIPFLPIQQWAYQVILKTPTPYTLHPASSRLGFSVPSLNPIQPYHLTYKHSFQPKLGISGHHQGSVESSISLLEIPFLPIQQWAYQVLFKTFVPEVSF